MTLNKNLYGIPKLPLYLDFIFLTSQKQYDIKQSYMAGSPERPTAHSLTTEEKDRIGSFYLSNLLKGGKRIELPRYPFGDIGQYIFEKIGAKIPADLANILSLNSLSWITNYHRDSLPRLFLGENIGSGEWTNNDLHSASVTIEIARRGDANREELVPLYLRIAGVNKEQKRIVAATYNLTDNNRLTKLNVSIPHFEYLECEKELSVVDLNKTVTAIPTRNNNPYRTAGFITEFMRGIVNELLVRSAFDGNESPHACVLIFKFDENNPILEKLGYYEERKDGVVTVGLEDEAARKKDLAPWKISIPESLPKV